MIVEAVKGILVTRDEKGKRIEHAGPVDLPKAVAEDAIARGVARVPSEEAPAADDGGGGGFDQERIAAIAAAIVSLDKDDASLWTRVGDPKVTAVRKASDLSDVSGAEIAAAVAEDAIARGVARVPSEEAPAADDGGGGGFDQERIAAIAAAIVSLDKDDASLWTRVGDPKVTAVRKASDLSDVSGAEIAAALAILQAGDDD